LGVTADGQFAMTIFAVLVSRQTRVGLPITGVLDEATSARLV
jgi:hypothetical protein